MYGNNIQERMLVKAQFTAQIADMHLQSAARFL